MPYLLFMFILNALYQNGVTVNCINGGVAVAILAVMCAVILWNLIADAKESRHGTEDDYDNYFDACSLRAGRSEVREKRSGKYLKVQEVMRSEHSLTVLVRVEDNRWIPNHEFVISKY